MDPVKMKEKLIAVLGQIQADSGLECPALTGTTKPVENIPKLSSTARSGRLQRPSSLPR